MSDLREEVMVCSAADSDAQRECDYFCERDDDSPECKWGSLLGICNVINME